MAGPMVTLAVGNSFLTASAMRCAAEWRMMIRPSGESSKTGSRAAQSVGTVRERSSVWPLHLAARTSLSFFLLTTWDSASPTLAPD